MTEERFKNYIRDVEPSTSCTAFLDKYRKQVSTLKNDPNALAELKIHKALSNSKRYIILKLLERNPMCTCALARVFEVSDGTITHHLKILEEVGLILGKKEGYYTRYYTKKNLIKTFS